MAMLAYPGCQYGVRHQTRAMWYAGMRSKLVSNVDCCPKVVVDLRHDPHDYTSASPSRRNIPGVGASVPYATSLV